MNLRNDVGMKDPEAENAKDKLWSREVAEVEAGGDEPLLERALAELPDCTYTFMSEKIRLHLIDFIRNCYYMPISYSRNLPDFTIC